jgi:hypothetical protein
MIEDPMNEMILKGEIPNGSKALIPLPAERILRRAQSLPQEQRRDDNG